MQTKLKNIVKVSLVANIFEWYEFCVFGYLAGIIGALFFSELNTILSLIKVFFIFAIGYLARPLGSVFFRYLGGFRGRNVPLKVLLVMMAVPTVALGLLPTSHPYRHISLMLLIILRMCQGFAAGGEFPLSACYAYEETRVKLKPLICGIVSVSSLLGVILGSLVVCVMSHFFSDQALLQGAWRIPFLASIPMTLYILVMRRNIEESVTHSFVNRKDYDRAIIVSWRKLLKGIILVSFLQVSFYILCIWMPSYLHYFLQKPLKSVHYINTGILLIMALSVLSFGYVVNEKNYIKIAGLSIVFTALLSVIIFYDTNRYSLSVLFLLELMAAIALAGLSATIFYILGQLFNNSMRAFAMTCSFTVATAIFGGTAPWLCSYVISATALGVMPAVYIVMFAIFTLITLFFIRKQLRFYRVEYSATDNVRLKQI